MMDFVQATLPYESTGLAPFRVEFGYKPRTSFDWNRPKEKLTAREKLSVNKAQAYGHRIQDAWNLARSNMEKAQSQQSIQANKY
jgi:hypothetical protein